jgi:SAM-dependent methyltransferase
MKKTTSWQDAGRWYDSIVGADGHYYHQHVIIPGVLGLLRLQRGDSVLDIGCGQGVLARSLPRDVAYAGLDIAPKLIELGKKYSQNRNHSFLIHDVQAPLPFPAEKKFTHATAILSLQNIEKQELVFQNIRPHLPQEAKFVFVLNHPAFRIPRQSSWGYDEKQAVQYRRIDSYMSPQKIPIRMHPGANEETTWSFHLPLSSWAAMCARNGFYIETIEEWVSPKTSEGGRARAENRARREFPLFLTIAAVAR